MFEDVVSILTVIASFQGVSIHVCITITRIIIRVISTAGFLFRRFHFQIVVVVIIITAAIVVTGVNYIIEVLHILLKNTVKFQPILR